MLSFSEEAAQGELGLLIKRAKSIMHQPRQTTPQVDSLLRAEAEWLRETYDTLTLVFRKKTHADSLLETGPRHMRGALSADIGTIFELRMTNRLSLLEQLRSRMGENMIHDSHGLSSSQ